jgi:hypothetical protein
MRYCSQHWLNRRCREAGRRNGECDGCIIERGDVLAVDETHADFPSVPATAALPQQAPPQPLPPIPTRGPGTELKKLLATVGITATPDCSCNARARTMDERGCDWCQEHIDEIVGWLREEAGRRKLPFVDAAGRMLVRRAIRNALKAEPA